MSKNTIHFWSLICLVTLAITTTYAQDESAIQDSQRIDILHADDIYFITEKGKTKQRLVGHVELYQDSTFMFLDSAIILDQHIDAFGHIVIQQGDSTNIYADTLVYEGDKRYADLYGKVVLEDKKQTLFTKQLHYNLKTKIGEYHNSALLTNGKTHLKSKKGRYHVKENYAFFQDSVTVLDSSFLLTSDSLKFHTEEEKAYFIAPTKIKFDSSNIYCEGGFYDFKTRNALFHTHASFEKDGETTTADTIHYNDATKEVTLIGNAKVRSPTKQADADWILYNQKSEDIILKGNASYKDDKRSVKSDEIYYNPSTETVRTKGQSEVWEGSQKIEAQQMDYDKVTGMGIATGAVVIHDTSANILMYADTIEFDKSKNYMKAIGEHPWIIHVIEDDSLFISADTFLTRQISEEDSTKILLAYNNVKMFKTDFQGVCDSLVYLENDSLFELYQKPVLWSDTSQFSGDTIIIHMKDEQMEFIDLRQHGFITNSEDEIFFNQIKGKRILTYFKDNDPHQTFIYGNAETLYFPMDEEQEYIGANKSICSEMKINYIEGKIDRIYYYQTPNSEMTPMDDPIIKTLKLDGFRWEVHRRPPSREAITDKDFKAISVEENNIKK